MIVIGWLRESNMYPRTDLWEDSDASVSSSSGDIAAFVEVRGTLFMLCGAYEYDMEVFTDMLERNENNEDCACQTTLAYRHRTSDTWICLRYFHGVI